MPRDSLESAVGPSAWTQLNTANAVTNLTFIVISGDVYIRCTATASTPPADELGLLFKEGEAALNYALTELAPGVTGPSYVWAKSVRGAATLWVSHA